MTTRDELQTLLQERLNVLQVELDTAIQSRGGTTEEKIKVIHVVATLVGARMELQLLARHLGFEVHSRIEMTRSDADVALYPSSEIYEGHVKGTCAQPHDHWAKKVS